MSSPAGRGSGPVGDLLNSLHLAVITAILQILVIWGLARETDLLRPIIIVTISTLTITRVAEQGPARGSGWAGIQGSYFRLILVLISFCTVIFAVAVRSPGQTLYVWDVLALVLQVIVSNAAITYAREVS